MKIIANLGGECIKYAMPSYEIHLEQQKRRAIRYFATVGNVDSCYRGSCAGETIHNSRTIFCEVSLQVGVFECMQCESTHCKRNGMKERNPFSNIIKNQQFA